MNDDDEIRDDYDNLRSNFESPLMSLVSIGEWLTDTRLRKVYAWLKLFIRYTRLYWESVIEWGVGQE